jgi:hypothetical protein
MKDITIMVRSNEVFKKYNFFRNVSSHVIIS